LHFRIVRIFPIQCSCFTLIWFYSPSSNDVFFLFLFPVFSIGICELGNLVILKYLFHCITGRRRSYTDTANFTLRCGVCQIGVIGQKVSSYWCYYSCSILSAYIELYAYIELGAILLDFYILIFIFMLIFRRLLNMRKPQAMWTFKNIDNRKQKLFISQGPW
jgi:hypothetical protein